jgi:DNA repair photolyase
LGVVNEIQSLKRKIASSIRENLSNHEVEEAARDYHAKRAPRPCGITVHPGVGCTYECKYCYVYDMGFNNVVKPYPLSGLQLIYALLSNKYFIPGTRGTYIAIGSVTEPFHPLLMGKTLEYIECIYKYLGNPTQFSTKQYIDKSIADKIYKATAGKISPLITIVTLKMHRELEPKQSTPERRLETIKNLRDAGLKPFLFLRPIIPGLTEYEYRELIDLALEYGVEGVVAGSLRVTKRTIDYLRDAGLDVREVLRRIKTPIEKMKPGIQYDVYTSDIKSEIARYARSKGLIFYPSACMANLHTHGLNCWKMCLQYGVSPCNLEKPSSESIAEILGWFGAELYRYSFINGELQVWIKCSKCDLRVLAEYLRSRFLTCTRVYRSR